MKKPKNILDEAGEITGNKSSSRIKLYGKFEDCMERAAKIARVTTGKQLNTSDIYHVLIALKLAREAHAHKRDNLLDLAGYVNGLQEYFESHGIND